MFKKILIANRGEIACRVARTARHMGIKTVAVYSEADRNALHVRQCDEAFLIGPANAGESYLCVPKLIGAAVKCGAEAIHPGYGFLSENTEFAEACSDNNIVFIGPPANAIRSMGSKSQAKDIMLKAGVPVVGGYQGKDQSEARLKAATDEIGYPVLIKAVSGGGGKGMRVVNQADQFEMALASVKRESAASFGDDRVLIEKYLPVARHVEVQVFADQHGDTIHLFERDCSIQRRHQKVIEEAPAPSISDSLRQQIGKAAVDAARSIGYVGAGTVEFLLDPDQRFYFMEMNTRLQVEHPVTEMITGQDLVEWQLTVAAGLPLPCRQQDLQINGHAMEARIYAENPNNNFLPATGSLAVYRHAVESSWLRVDSGVDEGDDILPFYDPMIAKLIVWGKDRDSARKRLGNALAEFDILGVTTNLGFLHCLTELNDFIEPILDTGLIQRNSETLFADQGDPPDSCLAIATLFDIGQRTTNRNQFYSESGDPFSPWSPSTPWQLNLPAKVSRTFATELKELDYIVQFEDGLQYGVIDGERTNIILMSLADGSFQFGNGGHLQSVSIHKIADTIHIRVGHDRWSLTMVNKSHGSTDHSVDDAGLIAPMPGTIIAVNVSVGTQVKKGSPLLVLEAMKMEHSIIAPHDGMVKQLFFDQGDQVTEGDQLLQLVSTEQG